MLQSVKELLPPDSDLVTLTRSQAGFSLFRIGAIKIIILYLLTKKSEINFPAISTSLSFLLKPESYLFLTLQSTRSLQKRVQMYSTIFTNQIFL